MINKDTMIFGSFSRRSGNSGCIFFNEAFGRYGINAIYKSFSTDSIGQAIRSANVLGFKGFAISMPFKKEVWKYVHEFSDEVMIIGAANTVVVNNGIMKAYNTDYLAAQEILDRYDNTKRLFILGDGGYAAAVKYAAKLLGIKFYTINRSNWSSIIYIEDSIVYNCTPVSDIKVHQSNEFIDCLITTETGAELSRIQAAHQFELYTGLKYFKGAKMDIRPKTLFIDVDGILLEHNAVAKRAVTLPKVLPGVLDKIDEWDRKGYNIILTSGRRESERALTEEQLQSFGIIYDQLVMGIGGGQRVLINDFKPNATDPTAVAICIERNKGLVNVEI